MCVWPIKNQMFEASFALLLSEIKTNSKFEFIANLASTFLS